MSKLIFKNKLERQFFIFLLESETLLFVLSFLIGCQQEVFSLSYWLFMKAFHALDQSESFLHYGVSTKRTENLSNLSDFTSVFQWSTQFHEKGNFLFVCGNFMKMPNLDRQSWKFGPKFHKKIWSLNLRL